MGNSKQESIIKEKKYEITGSTLKIVAIVCMLIDHIGAFLLSRMMVLGGYYKCTTEIERNAWIRDNALLYYFNFISRLIGRLAFPIFCFLLIEGFFYTRSRIKYLLRLIVFCFISEVPFDLVSRNNIFDWKKQNVFFTLALGLIMIWIVDTIYNRCLKDVQNIVIRFLVLLPIAAVFMFAAYYMHTDYKQYGVAAIALIYFLRANRELSIIAAVAALMIQSTTEVSALLIISLIKGYNGKRGLKMKYIFYIIYPLHLFIYYLIKRYFIG